METKIFVITGGAGSFGKFLAEELVKTGSKIVLLVKADSQKQENNKIDNLLSKNSYAGQITVFKCDLVQKNLGLTTNDYIFLARNTTHILHAAASTKFTLPLKESRKNNVGITENLLAFAKSCDKLRRFGFVSTAYVAGKRKGIILEEEFEHGEGFLNTYQQSKYEAEMLARKEAKQLPIIIFRPSLIITPFQGTGISPVNALTLGFFLAKKGFLPILPGNANNRLDIIEAELASTTIIQIFLKDDSSHLTYHITSATNSPSLGDLISLVEQKLGRNLPIRFCGDIKEFQTELKKITKFRPDLTVIYKKTQSFLPELAFPKIFNNSNLLKELKVGDFSQKPIKAVSSILD